MFAERIIFVSRGITVLMYSSQHVSNILQKPHNSQLSYRRRTMSSQQPAVRPLNLRSVQFQSTGFPIIVLFPAQKFAGSNPAPQTDSSKTYCCYPQSKWKNGMIISRITPRPIPYQFPILAILSYHTA